jgi:hypothetical protein
MVSLEARDPLGQRLRTPAERRVDSRFESEQRLVAGHDAFGQGVLGEVRAQTRHGAVELAHVAQGRCSSRLLTSPSSALRRRVRPITVVIVLIGAELDAAIEKRTTTESARRVFRHQPI